MTGEENPMVLALLLLHTSLPLTYHSRTMRYCWESLLLAVSGLYCDFKRTLCLGVFMYTKSRSNFFLAS